MNRIVFAASSAMLIASAIVAALAMRVEGTSPKSPPTLAPPGPLLEPVDLCLKGVRQYKPDLREPGITIHEFVYLGAVVPHDRKAYLMSRLHGKINGMSAPRGINRLFLHDGTGRVLCEWECDFLIPPEFLLQGELGFRDGSRVRIDGDCYLDWIRAHSMTDWILFPMSDAEIQTMK